MSAEGRGKQRAGLPPGLRTLLGALVNWWRSATSPHPTVPGGPVRDAAHLTAAITLLSIPLLVGVLVVEAPLFAGQGFQNPIIAGGLTDFVFVVASYLLCRSRWPAWGNRLLPLGTLIGVWVVVLVGGEPVAPAADALVIVPTLASLTLSLVATAILWIAVVVSYGYYLWLVHTTLPAGLDEHVMTIGLLVVVPPILLLAQAVRLRQARTIAEQSKRLAASQADLASLFEATPNPMLAADADGRIAYANHAAARLFGYELAEMRRLGIEDLVPTKLRHVHAAHRKEFADDPHPRLLGANRDLFGQRKDGSLVPVEIGLRTLDRPGGPLVLASVVDLTQRKHAEALEKEAIAREADLQRTNAVAKFRADLMNMVAHELKNPLTPIQLQMKVLDLAADELPEGSRKAMVILDRSVNRLKAQVEHMLEASRLESGTVKLVRAPVDLAKIVREASEAYQSVAAEGGVSLACDADGRFVVQGDADRLGQVVDNLLSNAIKYTPTGGRVAMRCQAAGANVRLDFQDTGLGLSQEQMVPLFQPFSRVHEPVRKGVPSTGLGLFISKGIVELHGGRLGVVSEGEGRGSTFWFELPLDGGPGKAPREAPAPPAQAS